MKTVALTAGDTPGVSIAEFAGCAWLLECRLLETDGAASAHRSPAGESLLLVLTGTHDLYAGGGSWLKRGVRAEPGAGMPVAVFLPPSTSYRLENGRGRALVFSARQPKPPEPATPREKLSFKPLLPLAGSGKAFDPVRGEWMRTESFLSSPEAILPRRIARIDCGGVEVRRVLGHDYKALGLGVDELALAAGQQVVPPPLDPWRPAEVAIYWEATAELAIDGTVVRGSGVAVGGAVPTLAARGGPAYVALAYAGPKPTT